MATKTITVTEKAYRDLARCKAPGESFTETIVRLTGERVVTAGDLQARLHARRAAGQPLFGSRLKTKGRARHAA